MNIAKQMNFVRPSCLAEGGDLVVKTDDTPLLGGWFSSFQKGVPKNKIKKYFKDYLYNQLVVDSSSCTLVSTFTALSNKYDVEVPYEVMREALEAMRRDGKFTNGVGAYLKDGVDYALDAFNRKFNKSIVARPFALDGVQLWYALGVSPVVTGFRYAEGFFADEQDNGKIDRDTRRIIWRNGHAVTIVKAMTYEGEYIIKYAESFAGAKPYNVITMNFQDYRPLFFNTAYYFV